MCGSSIFVRLRAIVAAILAVATTIPADACTRAVYLGPDGQTVTGRSMDWQEDMQTNLWIFPRGMARSGGLDAGALAWQSLYGSVVASVYEGVTADGMNEKGLVANILYLAESEYPPPNDPRPAVTVCAWTQYVLDRFATVAEAVAELRKETFRVVAITAPNGAPGTVHLAISDPSGDSAIFEYVGGKLVIHHGREYQVMTNSPLFDQQLALNRYWQEIGGTVMLPGTNRAADRFARASFYINASRQSAVPREAVAAVFSVMRNVGAPRGMSTPDKPNISSTIWRTVADQKQRVYYYESTFSPSVVWVTFADLDFGPASGVRKLQLHGDPDRAGNQTREFRPAEPFRFLRPKP
jgi:penicillin V acylase-like amidase (Ntn superfamily)